VHSASQIKKDTRALYGALLSACQGGVGRRILMENRLKQDVIRSWYQLVNQYETESNRNVRIKRLENVITTVYNRHYKGGLFNWIQDYEDAFTEYLEKGFGMMMAARNVVLFRIPRILAWWILYLKN
jgi:hypothetical protein